jgi:hypothetical protein
MFPFNYSAIFSYSSDKGRIILLHLLELSAKGASQFPPAIAVIVLSSFLQQHLIITEESSFFEIPVVYFLPHGCNRM